MLTQQQEDGLVRPTAYASRSLQKPVKNYKLEGLGVVWALQTIYLWTSLHSIYRSRGIKVSHEYPTTLWQVSTMRNGPQELNLTSEHRSAKHNANADALFHHPLPDSLLQRG